MPLQPTVFVPDPEDVLMPYAVERQVAEANGAEFLISDASPPCVQDAELIVTSLLRYPAEVLRELKRCQLIVVYGIGYDQIDVAAATECGIVVANTPTFCVAEVAEHTLSLMLSATRHLPWLDQQVRGGTWARANQIRPYLHRMSALTVGVIGLGAIAQAVIQRLRPFGCRILAYHPRRSAAEISKLGVQPVNFDELLQQSDIVSLHVPLTAETRHLIDKRALSLMKPNALLLNTSRGAVIEEEALITALETQQIHAAALDVFAQEPLAVDHRLLQIDPARLLLTPHFAGASQEALPAQQAEVAEAIGMILQGFWPRSTVNPMVRPKRPLRKVGQ